MPPLNEVTDNDLWNASVALAMACGRNQTVLRKKAREYLCYIRQSIDIEAELRGLRTPAPPHGIGQLRDTPPGAV